MTVEQNFFNVASWPALMSREAACSYLSIGKSQLRKFIADGTLKPVQMPGNERGDLRFRRIDLDRFIDNLPSAISSKAVRQRQERMAGKLAGTATE